MIGPSPENALREALTNLLDRPVSDAALAEHGVAAARPREDRREECDTLLAVRIGAEWFALPAAQVLHVGPAVAVHRVPHRSRPGFRGLANVDGRIVPVADLATLLGMTGPSGGDSPAARIVLFGEPAMPWACTVDEAPGMATIAHSDTEVPPLTVSAAPDSITVGLVPTEWGQASRVDMSRLMRLVDGLGL